MLKKMVLFVVTLSLCVASFVTSGSIFAVGSFEVELEGCVKGDVDSDLVEHSLTITLTGNQKFKESIGDTDLVDSDISDWFNLPEELEVIVNSVASGGSKILAEVGGKPEAEDSGNLIVSVPYGWIEGYEDNVEEVVSNEEDDACYFLFEEDPSWAYYSEDAIVGGYVGQELKTNKIYVQLVNDDLDLTHMDEYNMDPDIDNGLKAKIIDCNVDNIITIEYYELPTKEDYSDIRITIPSELLVWSERDLIVQVNDKDVRFNIVPIIEEEEEIPPTPEVPEKEEVVITPYIMVNTGIE